MVSSPSCLPAPAGTGACEGAGQDPGYLAIDQGPIVVMIENYRSGLLWELFMSCPEVQEGLAKPGFSY